MTKENNRRIKSWSNFYRLSNYRIIIIYNGDNNVETNNAIGN